MVDTIVNLQFNGNNLYNTDGSVYGIYSGNLVVDYTTGAVTSGTVTVTPSGGTSYSFSAANFSYYASTPQYVALGGFQYNLIAGPETNVYSPGLVTSSYTSGNFQLFYDSANPNVIGVTVISPGSTQSVTTTSNSQVTRTGNFVASDPNWFAGTGSYASLIDETVTSTVISTAACYARGTRLLARRGEIAIEALRIGDQLAVASGGFRPVVWIGERRLDLRRHPRPHEVRPVRVIAQAFGAGLPRCDLWLSPGHNIAFEGALIPISALVNGASIMQERRDSIEYWHVELDAHDVILAEGLPAESYLDCGNRTAFENGGAFLEAHPDFKPKHWAETCLPMAEGRERDVVRAHLRSRFSELGYAVTTDADPHLLADGRRVEPLRFGARRFGFLPPPGTRALELRSRIFRPAYSSLSNADERELGLSVTRLQIDGEDVALDDPRLNTGWHECERDGERPLQRWTDGAAALPHDAERIVVELGGDGLYWHRLEERPGARMASEAS